MNALKAEDGFKPRTRCHASLARGTTAKTIHRRLPSLEKMVVEGTSLISLCFCLAFFDRLIGDCPKPQAKSSKRLSTMTPAQLSAVFFSQAFFILAVCRFVGLLARDSASGLTSATSFLRLAVALVDFKGAAGGQCHSKLPLT